MRELRETATFSVDGFDIVLDVLIPEGGTAQARSVSINATGDHPVTSELVAEVAQLLGEQLDVAGGMIAREAESVDVLAAGGSFRMELPDGGVLQVVDGVGTYTTADGTSGPVHVTDLKLRVPVAYATQVTNELRRRRRARLTDDDYARVAAIYRLAYTEGESVQAAVRFAHDVDDPADAITRLRANDRPTLSTSGATKLIRECVRRGLLPPTTKGKRSAITTDGGTK